MMGPARRNRILSPQKSPYDLGGSINLRFVFKLVVFIGAGIFLLLNLLLIGRSTGQHESEANALHAPRYIIDRGIVGDAARPIALNQLIRHSWELDQQRDNGETVRAADLHAAAIAAAASEGQREEGTTKIIMSRLPPSPAGCPVPLSPAPPDPGWNQTDWPVWWFSPFFDHSSFGKEAATTVLSMVRQVQTTTFYPYKYADREDSVNHVNVT